MATNASRKVTIEYTGDLTGIQVLSAVANTASPGSVTIHTLSTGNNTITVPVGATVKAATIVPPAANLQALILKGVNGDTGITISKTDPTSIAFETAPTDFVINAGGSVAGLRIYWS